MKNLDQTFIKAFNRQRPVQPRQETVADRARLRQPKRLLDDAPLTRSRPNADRIRIDVPNGPPDAFIVGGMSVIPLAHITFPPVQHVETYDAAQIVDAVPDPVVLRDRMMPLAGSGETTDVSPASDPLSRGNESEASARGHRPATAGSDVDGLDTEPQPRTSAVDSERELVFAHAVSLCGSEKNLQELAGLSLSLQFVSVIGEELPRNVASASAVSDVGIEPTAPIGYEEVQPSGSICLLQLRRIDSPDSEHVPDEHVGADAAPGSAKTPASGPKHEAMMPESGCANQATREPSERYVVAVSQPIQEDPQPDTTREQTSEISSQSDATLESDRLIAAWEVDGFHWPEICGQLDASDGETIKQSGEELCLAARDGLRVLAVTSAQRHEGRTTMSLSLARSVAKAGARVALVDADRENPELARRLGVEAQSSWCETIEHGQPITDAAIASVNDGITLFPLTSPIDGGNGIENVRELTDMLQQLAHHFDLVVVDMQPIADHHSYESRALAEGPFDMAVVVRHVRTTPKETTIAAADRLRAMGLGAVGVVENFVPSESA